MTARRLARFFGAVVVTSWTTLLCAPVPAASAQPCPDVEAVFARGTGESPGVGGIGQAFVDALRSQVGGKSLEVYAVNYPASSDFGGGIQFAATVIAGISDAATHVQATAANCPQTRIARRLLARRGRGRLRHIGCCTGGSAGRACAPTDAARGG
jgi:cutinase